MRTFEYPSGRCISSLALHSCGMRHRFRNHANNKTARLGLGSSGAYWRRRRDSNPRDPFESNGFQDRRFQPLTHSSVFKFNKFCDLEATLLHSLPSLLHFGARCSKFVAVPTSFPTAATFEARLECVWRIVTVTVECPNS